jgi:hypothetical protein
VRDDSTLVALTRLLAERAPEHFCSTCIGLRLGVGLHRVRDALAVLAGEIVVHAVERLCSVCGRNTLTYGLTPKDAEASDETLTRFLTDGGDSGACQTCLARQLGLSLYTVQKGFWRLRASGRAVMTTGTCCLCGKLRILLQLTGPPA